MQTSIAFNFHFLKCHSRRYSLSRRNTIAAISILRRSLSAVRASMLTAWLTGCDILCNSNSAIDFSFFIEEYYNGFIYDLWRVPFMELKTRLNTVPFHNFIVCSCYVVRRQKKKLDGKQNFRSCAFKQ